MKRCYFVEDDYNDTGGFAVIARTSKEAKKVAMQEDNGDVFGDSEYIQIKAKWMKNVNVSDLDYGIMDSKEGLIRGAYGWIYDIPCGNCKSEKHDDFGVRYDKDDGFYCSLCIDEVQK